MNLEKAFSHRVHRDHREKTRCCREYLIRLSGEAKNHQKPALSLCSLWLELRFLG